MQLIASEADRSAAAPQQSGPWTERGSSEGTVEAARQLRMRTAALQTQCTFPGRFCRAALNNSVFTHPKHQATVVPGRTEDILTSSGTENRERQDSKV